MNQTQTQTILHIDGMTCINCQNKIEQALSDLSGVQKVTVTYKDGIANVIYDSGCISLRQIEEKIEELDYKVVPKGQMGNTDIIRIICIVVTIIALYILLQQLGILNLLVPSQLAGSGMGYGMLFLVGLLTSVHCIAMCGGINLSQCLPQNGGTGNQMQAKPAFFPSLIYNAGRVISYTVIGFLLGFIGMMFGGKSDVGIPVLVQGILKMAAGVFMVIMGINMLGIFPWMRRLNLRLPKSLRKKINGKNTEKRRPFVVGLFNGLMPCGPLQSIQILALASGNPLAGALSMMMFSMGTVPLMLGLGTIVAALGKKFTHTVMHTGAVLIAVLGLAMLSQGGALSGMLLPDRLLILVIGLAVIGIVASIPFTHRVNRIACIIVAVAVFITTGILWRSDRNIPIPNGSAVQVVDGVQLVNSTLDPGQYPTIMVQAGIPVRWTIHAPDGSINGCNYKVIIEAYGIEYFFEEGENVIEFIPMEEGNISYTCWMGMIQGNIIVT